LRQQDEKRFNKVTSRFLEEADKMGTLDQILEQAGFSKHNNRLEGPTDGPGLGAAGRGSAAGTGTTSLRVFE
jgi:hypothetical protein